MPNEPLLPFVIAKQLGAGHEEDAPALKPLGGLRVTVGLLEDRHDRISMRVHVFQPRIAGALVVRPVPAVTLLQLQLFLETQRQVVAGHDAAGKEMPAHPVVFALVKEKIGVEYITKDSPITLGFQARS